MTQIPAGWYPNPDNPSVLRWWDGSRWTQHTTGNGGGQADQRHQQATQPPLVNNGGPVASGTSGTGSGGLNPGAMAAIVVAGLLLVVGAVLAVVLGGNSGGSPTASSLGSVRSGHTQFVHVGSGTHRVSFEAPPGRIVIDIRGDRYGWDAVARLRDDRGTEVAHNDDRGLGSLWGGDNLDPLLDTWIPGGSYTLEIWPYGSGNGGRAEVIFQIVGG